MKDRSAGVELEAHRRAQGVLDQANSQARHLRQQMEQWMTRVGREYDALRTEVEATISHAADQLDKAGKCLEQVSALLSDQDVALEELSRAYDSTAPDKVPAPGSAGRGALSSLSCDAAPGTPLSSSLPLGEGGAAYAETDEGASFRRADQYRTGESEICTCPPRSLNDLMWEKTDRGSRIS